MRGIESPWYVWGAVGIEITVADARVFPLIQVTREQLAAYAGGTIIHAERVDGGLTNTIHKVRLDTGEELGVKVYAGGRDWFETELMTLTLLHGTIPVPDVVHVDEARHVIAYRWIEGITLHELRKAGEDAAYASLAEPLGRVLAWVARTDATEPFDVSPLLERAYVQLTTGRTRQRIGDPLAAALRQVLEGAEPELAWGAVSLSHGDLGHRNVLVHQLGGRWRINGVIDWETATTSSPLADIGSLFRYARRHDDAFRAAFARGYREAGGELPARWLLAARLLDATELIDVLDEPRELPNVYADCRRLLHELVADARSGAGAGD